MSNNGKLPGGYLLAAAICFTLLVLYGPLHGKASVQNAPVTSSAEMNDPQNPELEPYLKALRGEDATEKHSAVISLGKSGNPAAVEHLIKVLDEDDDYFVRSFAAIALGNLKNPRALEPLTKALGDEHQRVRRSAAEALASIKNPNAIDPLIKALKDENVLVRRAAANALGKIGDPKAVNPLMEALGDADSYIWTGASIALAEIGSAAIPGLVNALSDWALGPKAAETLNSLNWQPSSNEEKVRIDVAKRSKEALLQDWEFTKKILVADANSGNTRMAENAVYALIGIGREDAVDPLATILQTRGTAEMAKAFLESGNARLSELALNWAKEHGKEIRSGEGAGILRWGEMKA